LPAVLSDLAPSNEKTRSNSSLALTSAKLGHVGIPVPITPSSRIIRFGTFEVNHDLPRYLAEGYRIIANRRLTAQLKPTRIGSRFHKT
jgi:hypothetical protein